MSKKTIAILKSFFETGDRPTEQQFADLIDSFHHKDTGRLVTAKTIDNLTGLVRFEFEDSSFFEFTVPKSAPISFITDLQAALDNKVDKVTGKGLSTLDFTAQKSADVEAAKLHTEDGDIHVTAQDKIDLANKVDKINGKGLSTNDFGDAEAQKVIDANNHVNNNDIHVDLVLKNRVTGASSEGVIELNSIAGKVYGESADLTGNLVLNDLSSTIGGAAVIYHKDGVAPSISTGLTKNSFGTYTLNARNLIVICKIGAANLGIVYKAISAAGTVIDTEAPTAPTTINATNVGTNSYNLAWSGETDNIGVTGFRISDNGSLIDVASSPYTVNPSSIGAGAIGTIQILSKDAAGNESPYSAPIDVYMKFELSGFSATPNADPTKIDLVWAAVNSSANIDNYIIERSTDNIAWTVIATLNNLLNSYQDTALTDATLYYYRLQATDNESLHISSDYVSSSATTGAQQAQTVESTLQSNGEWYDFTDKSVGAFAPFIGKKGNYTTALVAGTPEYIAGTKLKTLRAENDVIDLGSTFAHLKNSTDGISIFVKFAPTEIGYTTYFLGQTDGNNQIIIGLNTSGQMYMLSKMGVATLVVNTTTNPIWTGAAPYAVKNLFIEIVKSSGDVKFYDGTTLLTVTTPAPAGDISLYNSTYRWYLGARNNVGTTDVANDISAEFEHVIINTQLLTTTEKQFIIDNV